MNIYTTQKTRDNDEETVRASCPEHIVESNSIHPANATHSIRGSKTLGRHRPTTAPRERSWLLSNGGLFLFVSFQLWNEQLQRGIRTHFKQGQIKVHSPKLPSILYQGKVYSTLITLLFSPSLLISHMRSCFFCFFFIFPSSALSISSLLSLLQCDLLQGPQGGI